MNARSIGFVTGAAAVTSRQSFCGASVCGGRPAAHAAPAAARVYMRSDVALQVKKDKVTKVREDMAAAESVFQVGLDGITVSQISQLKNEMPEGSTCRTVKNTLMRRAIEGTDWSIVGDLCTGSTVWFFVNDDLKGTVGAYTKWAKSTKKGAVLGGAMDGAVYDGAQINAIADLPTKQELYQQIAVLLKAVPTKLGRTVNQVPTKVARAINLAINDSEGGGEAAAE